MFLYALIDPLTNEVTREIEREDRYEEYNTRLDSEGDGTEDNPGNGKSFILPMIRAGDNYDQATHVRTGPVYEVTENQCVARFTVIPKPQAQLDKEAAIAADPDINEILDALLSELSPAQGSSLESVIARRATAAAARS